MVGPAHADARAEDATRQGPRPSIGGSKRSRPRSCARNSLTIYVPRLLELGLTIRDPEPAEYDEAEARGHTPSRLDELRTVVTNDGPKSQERLESAARTGPNTASVRKTILGAPVAAA